LSTNAPSGEISGGKLTSYDESIGALTKAINRLSDLWEQGSKAKIEEEGAKKKEEEDEDEEVKKEEEELKKEEEAARKIEARRMALRRLAARRRALHAEVIPSPKMDEEVQRKKLEELKSKIAEVKKRVEEAKTKRDEAKMEARASGKAEVGATKEEKPTGVAAVPTIGAGDHPLPAYWSELMTASRKYKEMGFLSSG